MAEPGARYRSVRALTEELASGLAPEDQVVQSMPDVSPTKWHRAHTTWFFETFLLGPHDPSYPPYDERYGYLFNSYYEAVGARHPRPERGLLSRPTADEVTRYREHVDRQVLAFLERDHPADVIAVLELGLNHEQQHQELLLMDIAHVFSCNPLDPEYGPPAAAAARPARPLGWLVHDGGIVRVGHDGEGFAFDNESPAHDVLLGPFRVGDRLVTEGEWCGFMADGGYRRAALWLSDGWRTLNDEGWEAPLYWRNEGGGDWSVFTLRGRRPVDAARPVTHVSHYEADAFARWAGARLPTEFEWEAVARAEARVGNFLSPCDVARAPLDPEPAPASSRQLFGDTWEWTASAYLPYPGFRAAPGAVGEYNGKFMSNQMVLRGGACVTPAGHLRPTYRNFFPPHSRWMFSGVRLASDA